MLNLPANCGAIAALFGCFATWCFVLCLSRLKMSFCSFEKRVSGYIHKSFSVELVGDVCNAR